MQLASSRLVDRYIVQVEELLVGRSAVDETTNKNEHWAATETLLKDGTENGIVRSMSVLRGSSWGYP